MLDEFGFGLGIHDEIVVLAEVLVAVAVLVDLYGAEMVDVALADQPLLPI